MAERDLTLAEVAELRQRDAATFYIPRKGTYERALKMLLRENLKAAEGRVYFVCAPAFSAVKIGTSTDPIARLGGLQSGFPTELRLLGTIQGSYRTERRLHHKFKAHRLRGEWFRLSPEILEFIKKYCKAANA